jgi:organic hydroperoxide reductase OsmC/OhrA
MSHRQTFQVDITWTGNRGTGTSSYGAYGRDHELGGPGKPQIPGSSEPRFRGDPARWNPEELVVGAVAACHQLWYLHLCADAGVVVTAYEDRPEGVMIEEAGGEGQFERVVLRPRVTLAPGGDAALAERLHSAAHAKCAIARSMAFPVTHEPTIVVQPETPRP